MRARSKGNWLAVFFATFCLVTAFAAGAWAGDAAKFVSETYPDNTSMAGGKTFTKTWTIKNSGTTTWTSKYKLKYVSGSLSTSQSSVAISGTVKPGSSYTFSVPMKAPVAQSSEKTYREDWKFTNSSSSTVKVGNSSTIWAQIKVQALIVDDYGDSCSKAADISVNSSKNGKIDFAGDNDYFRVSLSSKGTLTAYTTGSTDTYGRLLNSNCQALDKDNDAGGGGNFKISKMVPAGTYYVQVQHNSSTKTGSYALNVAFSVKTAINQLNVPYLKQQNIPKYGKSACASASAAMILAYYGKVKNSEQDMIDAALDVWKSTGSTIEAGLNGNIKGLGAYFLKKGFSSWDYDDSSWKPLYEKIKAEIANGNPMILRTKSVTTPGHYLVVIGYEGDDYKTGKIIVNDPYGQWNGKIDSYSTKVSGSGLKYSFVAVTKYTADAIISIHP